MGIPVTGREEDAADIFSTLLALMCRDSFADRVLANAALGWFLSDRRDRRQGVPIDYYDEHGMDLQRAYNVVCLMVGSNMGKFASIAMQARVARGAAADLSGRLPQRDVVLGAGAEIPSAPTRPAADGDQRRLRAGKRRVRRACRGRAAHTAPGNHRRHAVRPLRLARADLARDADLRRRRGRAGIGATSGWSSATSSRANLPSCIACTDIR